jgi:HlyD family secretion protein
LNRNRWIAAGLIVLLVIGGLAWRKTHSAAKAPKYRMGNVERGDLTATVSATGNVQPVKQVQVGSQVSGTVSKLNADYNSIVKEGQVLCRLETSAFRARLDQAEAAVAKAQASLKDGQRQLRRAQELMKGDFVSQADVDAAEVAVEQRQADLKQAQATLTSAQVDLGHATIRSPISGVVISRSIDVGQTVAASLQAPQLFVIANDLKQMQVETKIDEADIGRIRMGLPVKFSVDAFPDAAFGGTVSQVRLEPVTESNVVTYTTVIATRNDDLRLKPGMTANVTVQTDTRQDVLKVPNAALRFRPAGMEARGMGGNGQGGQGAGGGGGQGGGMRRTFGALLGAITPAAYAQDATSPGGGSGGWRGSDDPYVQQIRDKVKSGELTRDQARELIQKHFAEKGGAPAAGSGAPTAPGGAARGSGKGAMGATSAPSGAGSRQGSMDSSPPGANSLRGGFNGKGGGRWGMATPDGYKPGVVWVLRENRPARVVVMTGITDGSMTEVKTDELKEGDSVIVGLEIAAAKTNSNLTAPPGMGGPQFRGPGGGGGGRR